MGIFDFATKVFGNKYDKDFFFVAIINIKNEVRQTGRPNHFAGLSK